MRRRFVLPFLLILSPVSRVDAQVMTRFKPSSFQLYYGNDPALVERLTRRITPGQIVVVESRALSKTGLASLRRRAERTGAKVISYISIGELHDNDEPRFRAFLKTYQASRPKQQAGRFRSLEDLTIRRNEPFHSRQVDVLAPVWQAFVLAEVDRLNAPGNRGLFLDTVDTVDLYIGRQGWDLARRIESVEAMKALIRTIKKRSPGGFVLQNRGLNLIGAKVFVGDATGKEIDGLALAHGHAENPDGVLWEDAFASDDEWSRLKERQLREIERSGRATVFALGYKETLGSMTGFFKKSADANFIPAWATSSKTLHLELTDGRP